MFPEHPLPCQDFVSFAASVPTRRRSGVRPAHARAARPRRNRCRRSPDSGHATSFHRTNSGFRPLPPRDIESRLVVRSRRRRNGGCTCAARGASCMRGTAFAVPVNDAPDEPTRNKDQKPRSHLRSGHLGSLGGLDSRAGQLSREGRPASAARVFPSVPPSNLGLSTASEYNFACQVGCRADVGHAHQDAVPRSRGAALVIAMTVIAISVFLTWWLLATGN
jgi:hypothetical protein